MDVQARELSFPYRVIMSDRTSSAVACPMDLKAPFIRENILVAFHFPESAAAGGLIG